MAGIPAAVDASSTTVSCSACSTSRAGMARVRRRAPAGSATVHPHCASASTARSVSSPGSPGPAPRKVTCPWAGQDGMVRCGGAQSARSPIRPAAPLASISREFAAERLVPRRATRVRDRWWTTAPARSRRCVPTTPRRRISLTACPSARRSASAPTGALQPASRAASRDRSAVTAARVYGSSSSASEAMRSVLDASALDGQCPLAGGGQDRVDRQEARSPRRSGRSG